MRVRGVSSWVRLVFRSVRGVSRRVREVSRRVGWYLDSSRYSRYLGVPEGYKLSII